MSISSTRGKGKDTIIAYRIETRVSPYDLPAETIASTDVNVLDSGVADNVIDLNNE